MRFDFHKSRTMIQASHHRTVLGKPMPSKWDDAQKWLVSLSRGGGDQASASPRDSNADDRRLIVPAAKKGCSIDDEWPRIASLSSQTAEFEDGIETKNVDGGGKSKRMVRTVCVRDIGTEMTPIASQEASRAATPVRAGRSPVASDSGIEFQAPNEGETGEGSRRRVGLGEEMREDDGRTEKSRNSLEIKAIAWDEAERAKYTARYKREELKIQAWENDQKRKAEAEMRKIEAKVERLKARAQETYAKKLAATRRMAETKREEAEAKFNEMGVKTSERADCIRKTGRLRGNWCFE